MWSRSAARQIDIVLELVHLAVGIDDLPHHLDDAQTPGFVERAIEQAGEAIEIDGFAIGGGRSLDQRVGLRVVEIELLSQDRAQLVVLLLFFLAVDGHDMNEQRRGREPVIAGLELRRGFRPFAEFGQKAFQGIEHARAVSEGNGGCNVGRIGARLHVTERAMRKRP